MSDPALTPEVLENMQRVLTEYETAAPPSYRDYLSYDLFDAFGPHLPALLAAAQRVQELEANAAPESEMLQGTPDTLRRVATARDADRIYAEHSELGRLRTRVAELEHEVDCLETLNAELGAELAARHDSTCAGDPVTALSWAEARKAEDAAHHDVVLYERMQAGIRRASPEDQAERRTTLAGLRAEYRAARHASDVALVRRVLDVLCRRGAQPAIKLGGVNTGRYLGDFSGNPIDPEAVLAEITKEER